ncbi:hypothetical protein E2C01_078884 [Portunus trituberculatus]|uniref:Uncharacterized protein n=1 Tax=Portunus trituberculatus TaxID=210409 RepID=A0A5B7IRA9_PORTR|nr:hypothetical protein [Portunus trituberculatus]
MIVCRLNYVDSNSSSPHTASQRSSQARHGSRHILRQVTPLDPPVCAVNLLVNSGHNLRLDALVQ